MFVAELWRYPVKSMAGERLDRAMLGEHGVVGDRVVHARRGGRPVTARSHPELLGLRGSLGPDGEVLVDGRPWRSSEVAAAVTAAAGEGVRLEALPGGEPLHDVLPLLVATDGAIAQMGFDGRRLRPNLVIGGVDGHAEREWAGKRLRIGEVVLALDQLRMRCVMTTFDPDTLEQDHGVLKRIVKELGGSLALDTAVVVGGEVRVGDAVELFEP
jgi:uncharacterized protein